MQNLLAVCAGGAIGAGARYLVGILALRVFGPGFPWGTLTVNIAGSLFMGLAAQYMMDRADLPQAARLFIMTGILGGFTTFSAYALDIVALSERNMLGLAMIYAMASVAGSVAALLAGQALARTLMG